MRGDRRCVRSGDCGDLAVELAYETAKSAARSRNGGIGPCGGVVEWQDAVAEIDINAINRVL